MNDPQKKYFLPYQIKWINDHSPLRIIENPRMKFPTKHASRLTTISLNTEH